MNELILPDEDGGFLAHVSLQHKEAVDSFMRFFRDKDAYSPNTIRDLRLVMGSWGRWCRTRGIPGFPIEEESAREYLLALFESGLASTSISKHYAMLNMILEQCNMPSLSTSKTVSLTMRRIRREAATVKGERSGQAIPLRWDDIKLIDVLLSRSGRLVDLRNRAFLYVAYNTLLRMSEMSRIRIRDLELIGDTVTININHTKTMTTVSGVEKRLARCTTSVLNDWLGASGLGVNPDAILFPPVGATDKARMTEKPMSAPALEKIFSDAWNLLGKDAAVMNKGRYRTWTGHSARVGAAIDMADKQVSLVDIMREGTWKKPETLMRYLRRSSEGMGANSILMDS